MARKRLHREIVFLFFKMVSFFILILPLRVSVFVGACLGRVCFYILEPQRQKALHNLNIAFGDTKSAHEKRIIAEKVFENLGINVAEIVSFYKLDKKHINKYIRAQGFNIIEDIAGHKRPAIILSAHLGNWEMLAHYLALNGFPIHVVARRVRMDAFERFLDKARKRNGLKVLHRDDSAKEAVKVLKAHKFLGVMPDQDMDSVSGVFVDFFGIKAWTPHGPSALHFLTGAPIIPLFIVRRASGFGLEILVEEPMELIATGDRKKDIAENTQRYTRLIENYIRRFPEQWVWFHERWKTRPVSGS